MGTGTERATSAGTAVDARTGTDMDIEVSG